ncbi:MAG: hypothetical protein K0R93_259 [Anaerosolibacter sp.]|jgi:spore germination protein KC|uniref:Ger(x)C family spore germination protein n=1 Tax=Anaerosolibacter sp. TaxID=1872527 RepID=UPI002608C48B|nr:Ger(x)C family spore germination protein [Anaerosolibacter sp.]MDF2545361.1 hypothetical protein [Anaerosolibacter sp.]
MQKGKIKFFLICFISIASLTGCWSNKNLNSRALVAGVGLDRSDDGQVELTLQIIRPSAVGNTEGGKLNDEPVWIHSSKGTTVFEAVRAQLTTINRKPYYSHVVAIVIGEEMAKSGIEDLLDFFERDAEPRLTSKMLIAKGTTAKKILSVKSKLETIPAQNISQITENRESNPVIQQVTLFDLLQQLSTSGREATIGAVEISDEGKNADESNIRVSGSAVFKRDRLVGWLDPIETAGVQYILGDVTSGIIVIQNPNDPSKMISIEEVGAEAETKVVLDEDRLGFRVDIKAKGNVGSQRGHGDITSEAVIRKIEEETAQVIKSQILQAINVSKNKYNSDIFGFGAALHREYPKIWRQVQDDWDRQYQKATVDVTVEFKIKQLGLIGKSLEIQ